MKKFSIKGDLFIWAGMQGSWYFVYVGDEASSKIKDKQKKMPKYRGFGAVKVKVKIGETQWTTSIFPTKEGPYILPIKASVRKAEGLFDGDTVKVDAELL